MLGIATISFWLESSKLLYILIKLLALYIFINDFKQPKDSVDSPTPIFGSGEHPNNKDEYIDAVYCATAYNLLSLPP